MMALDVGRAFTTSRFNDIWIKSPLDKELDFVLMVIFSDDVVGRFLEGPNELPSNCFPLGLGVRWIGEVRQSVQKSLMSPNGFQLDAGSLDVVSFHLLPLALAQQTMIYENAPQLIAYCPMNECCGNGRINPARQSANNVTGPDCAADRLYRIFNNIAGRPRRLNLGVLIKEPFQDLLPIFRV